MASALVYVWMVEHRCVWYEPEKANNIFYINKLYIELAINGTRRQTA